MAETRIEIEVTAENQQAGMVAAHDAILLATREQAKNIHLNLGSATIVAFDPVSGTAPQAPPAAVSRSAFSVARYRAAKCLGSPEQELSYPTYDQARAQAETVLKESSEYGSACVRDDQGIKVLEVNAPRGGWEVLAQSDDAQHAPQRFTWIDCRAEARATAMQLIARKAMAFVQIIDYTDRLRGPVLWKEIR